MDGHTRLPDRLPARSAIVRESKPSHRAGHATLPRGRPGSCRLTLLRHGRIVAAGSNARRVCMVPRLRYCAPLWLCLLIATFVFASSASATTPGVNGGSRSPRIRPAVTSSIRFGRMARIFYRSPTPHGLPGGPTGRRTGGGSRSFGIGFDYTGIAIIHPDGSHRRVVPTVPETVCDCEPAYGPAAAASCSAA